MRGLGRTFVWRETSEGVWIDTEIPGTESPTSPGWVVSGLFFPYRGQLALAEVRVIPNVGRYKPAKGSKPFTIKAGTREWVFGGVQVTRGKGDWSRKARDFDRMPDGGVSARLLRRVPIQSLIDQMHLQLGKVGAGSAPPRLRAVANRSPARPGRAGRPDLFYAEWAARYVRVSARSKSPVADLAAKHGVKATQVRDWLHESRSRGLLSKEGRGRKGGILTTKAELLLAPGSKGKGAPK